VKEPPSGADAERALVARAIGGDEAAFAQLYDHYSERIYRHVYYRVGRQEDAEDVTQQVFMQAWRALGRYRQTETPFVAWLMTIAHNAVVSFYRRARGAVSLDAEGLDPPAPSEAGLAAAEARVDHEQVRRAMRELRPELQQVLAMRFLEDLPTRDVASALGITEGNVRIMQHRALHALRKLLDAEAP
jgi:RNA polymerase sigma-70 factor (ECF subfamily)